ncbi:MAG: Flp pilus assembly protein CpaB [Planctomycetaceae bacterium]|nr:Flp pilus assembly protein CpaB [Planctomycetaceae bacterium]
MKMKSVVLLAVAAGCGLVAMLGVQQALSGREASPQETGDVLVALTDVPPGVPLDETNVKFRQWPKEQIPAGAVTTLEEYEACALRVRAYAGEIILKAKLGEPGVFGAASEIPTGMRVVTVSVDLTMIASGMIRPGDRVDVVVSYRSRAGDSRGAVSRTQTVLEYIKVFATDNVRDMSGQENGSIAAKNISLLATPEQANLLKLAENMGKLHLTLRSRTDDQPSQVAAIDERIFAEAEASMGEDNGLLEKEIAAKSTALGVVEPKEERSIRDLLMESSGSAPAADPAVAVNEPVELEAGEIVEEVPEVPTWKITIYAGDEVQEKDIEIPASMLPKPEVQLTPDVPAGLFEETGTSRAAGQPPRWQKLLSTFFTGA